VTVRQLLELLHERGHRPEEAGKGWTATCPLCWDGVDLESVLGITLLDGKTPELHCWRKSCVGYRNPAAIWTALGLAVPSLNGGPLDDSGPFGSEHVNDWPEPLDDAALHGRSGDFVRLVDPHTEADPAALLVSFLIAVGNAVGHGPYFEIGADRHGANLNAVVVGSTGEARKGSSLGWVRKVVRLADPSWGEREIGNLGSGEVVIWEVRDQITKAAKDGALEIVDPGVADKRLFIAEEEFASVLRVAGRGGNVLSPILRKAWDTGELRHGVKNSPARASGAHVSMVGHITPEELRRELTDTEQANGFGNRILWICAKRSKLLPRGGSLVPSDLEDFALSLEVSLDRARGVSEVKHDGGFWDLWDSVYEDLSRPRPGLIGAILGRAAPQVRRLALIYALLDSVSLVTRRHLEAALAVWAYAEDSARVIFGDATGDPNADAILRALRRSPGGMTRWQINDILGGHRKSGEISRALEMLSETELAYSEREPTGGRPAERWYALRRMGRKRRKHPGEEAFSASSPFSAFSAPEDDAS
jgi:hypothetical protein